MKLYGSTSPANVIAWAPVRRRRQYLFRHTLDQTLRLGKSGEKSLLLGTSTGVHLLSALSHREPNRPTGPRAQRTQRARPRAPDGRQSPFTSEVTSMHPLLMNSQCRGVSRGRALPLTLCAALLLALCARGAHAQSCVQEDCLPSPSSAYASTAHFNFSFLGTTYDLSGLSLHNFSSCGSPPASVTGATATHSFTAVMDYIASVNGGPAVSGSAPASATLFNRFNSVALPTRFFDTEMLQLDISGGGLPLAAMIRESPSLATTGTTKIEDLGSGTFRVDSFFDVFFELSLDGGVTWAPSLNAPGKMTLTGPGCPTPTRRHTWGHLKQIYR